MSGRSHIESDAWLAAIVQSSDDGIVSKTLDGVIMTWNQAAERIFGYTAEEAVGRPITLIIPPERQSEEPQILAKIAGGQRIEHFETERVAKDGRRLIVSLTVSPIRDRQGRIVGASKIVRDVTAQRNLERRLRESEQRWELAVSATQDGIWEWDLVNDRVYWSPRCMEMLGYTVDDFVPTREFIRGLMHPEDRDRGYQTAQRHVRGETEIYADEYRLRHRDGSYRWILSRGRVLRDAQGRPVRMVGAHTDITDRRAAEAAAREAEAAARDAEQRQRAVFEAIRDAMIVYTPEGVVVDANPAALEMYGYSREQIVGIDAGQAVHPDARPSFEEFLRIAGSGGTYHCETVDRRLDGSEFPIEALGTSFTYAGKRHLLAVIRDISARRQAEAALRDSEERLRTLVEQSAAGIAHTDLSGRILFANRRFCQITGYSQDELTRRRVHDLTHPDDLPETTSLVGQARTEGQNYAMEKRYVRKDGGIVWVSVSASVLRDAEGRPQSIMGVVVDITGRKRAEEERRKSEYRFQRLVEQSPLSTQIFAPDGTTRRINRAWEVLWGGTMADLEGYNILQDEQLEKVGILSLIRKAFAGEAVAIDPVPYVPDRGGYAGQVRWVGAYAFPVKDDTGRIEEVVLVHHDVTEARVAQEALARSTERLELAQRAAHIGVFDWDVQTGQVVWNEQEERLFGLEPGSFEGTIEAWNKRLLPEDAPRVGQELADAMAHRQAELDFHFRILRPDGAVRWIEGRGRFFYDDAGTPLRMIGVNLDATERREYEAALRDERARISVAQQAAQAAAWGMDLNTGAVDWSPELYDLIGLDRSVVASYEVWLSLLHPEDRERIDAEARQMLSQAGDYRQEFRILHPAKGTRWCLSVGRVISDEAGGPVRLAGMVLDITERKQAEAEREELLKRERAAREQAEQHSRIKDEFLATLSHELRTPLNAILGWSSILRAEEADSRGVREGLEIIERNARAQAQIIDDLLDMSRIISGKVRLEVRSINPETVVRAAMETVRPAADAKGVRLTGTFDPNAGPIIADPNRLQQVFWNLLSNAVKFTPRGGQVQVMLRRSESQIELTISDTGEGIAADFLPHVFDRFRQADSSTTRSHGGLGLGLSIVRHLVEQHGGAVRAASAGKGRGATFTVLLPVSALQSAPEPAPAQEAAGAAVPGPETIQLEPLTGVRVLVVDDEPDARALVRRLLESRDAAVTTAASATEAMALLESERPDVLICDIGMPEADGYALIRRIRALSPVRGGAIPAIALTAYARPEDRVQAIRAGFQLHIAKPVEPSELIATVASLARRQRY